MPYYQGVSSSMDCYDRSFIPFSGDLQRDTHECSKLSSVVQRQLTATENRPEACQHLARAVRTKIAYLAGLEGSRKRPTTCELEHSDGEPKNNERSCQW
jgi:hypothetical protein